MKTIQKDDKEYVVGDLFYWEAFYANGKLLTANIELEGDYSAYFNLNEDESGTLVLEYDDVDYAHEMSFNCPTIAIAEVILKSFISAHEMELEPKYIR